MTPFLALFLLPAINRPKIQDPKNAPHVKVLLLDLINIIRFPHNIIITTTNIKIRVLHIISPNDIINFGEK